MAAGENPEKGTTVTAITPAANKRPASLCDWFLVLAVCWTILIAALAAWDYREACATALAIARSTAGDSIDKDLLYRRWAGVHSGVIIPEAAATTPKPYSAPLRERDIATSAGKKPALMDPTCMPRQGRERGQQQQGERGHVTSLKPSRPENAPDEWEKEALLALEQGKKEVSSLEILGNDHYFRLMRPLVTERGCLTCHASQGYKEGDIRGGLSVSVPWAPSQDAVNAHVPMLLMAYGGIWAIGILGLYVFQNRLRRHLSNLERSESALQESERKYRKIFDSFLDLYFQTDLEGTILNVSPSVLTLSGWSSEEVIGKSGLSLYSNPKERELYFGLLSRNGRATDCELTLRKKDGGLATVSVCSRLVHDGDGRPIGVEGTMRDITDRKRAEIELKRTVEALETANKDLEQLNQLAESATRAKSEFLANMSHEIRTPMTAIMGFADVLLGEEGITDAPPERIEAVRTIRRNGQYLLELINDILDVSKIEAGKLEVERIACSPAQVLCDVIALMRIRADAKNLPLKLEFVGGIPESIQSDPLRLRQVLINLVGNAIKFTEAGNVRVVARLVQGLGKPAMMQFDVIDTGIGLSQQQISQLFRPFNQADSSTTRKFGGTGLGLTISKRLAEMLGGGITVSSTPGGGSTFSVTIAAGNLEGVKLLESPVKAAVSTATASAPASAAAILPGCRILLAEDGPDNQRLIRFVLEKAGAGVTVVENGLLAVKEASIAWEHGHSFELILMDMQMPIMDGYTATRQLRDRGYSGPIIALTAHAMNQDRQKCLDAGCNDYAVKPIDRQTLLATVARWAARLPATQNV